MKTLLAVYLVGVVCSWFFMGVACGDVSNVGCPHRYSPTVAQITIDGFLWPPEAIALLGYASTARDDHSGICAD